MALAGKNVQVLVAGYDLTGDSNKLMMNDSRNVHDVTAFGDGVHRFIVGPRVVALSHAGYLNSAAAASHPVLKSAAVQGPVSVLLGQNANPAVGDPALGSDYKALSGTIPQYTRWKATRTGSAGNTVKIAVTLVRF